jgi:hypothetical protein
MRITEAPFTLLIGMPHLPLIPKSSDSVRRRRLKAEHAARSLALVLGEPRLPFRTRRMVGLLRFAFFESLSGRTPFARIQRSKAVSNWCPIACSNIRGIGSDL